MPASARLISLASAPPAHAGGVGVYADGSTGRSNNQRVPIPSGIPAKCLPYSLEEPAVWINQAASIESAADRREFINGVVGFRGPGLTQAALAGVLAWSIWRSRRG